MGINSPDNSLDEIEVVSDSELIAVLKKQGLESPDAVAILDRWLEAKQAEASKDKSALAGLDLNVRLAEIYYEAGLKDTAYDAFWDAVEQANQEGSIEKVDQIKAKMEPLDWQD